jgi:hypothetical protein
MWNGKTEPDNGRPSTFVLAIDQMEAGIGKRGFYSPDERTVRNEQKSVFELGGKMFLNAGSDLGGIKRFEGLFDQSAIRVVHRPSQQTVADVAMDNQGMWQGRAGLVCQDCIPADWMGA